MKHEHVQRKWRIGDLYNPSADNCGGGSLAIACFMAGREAQQ
jgi:hypothetical protein